MKIRSSKTRTALLVLLAVLFVGGGVTPSEATLELKGKDGTSSLSKIDDIIRFITGKSTASQDLTAD